MVINMTRKIELSENENYIVLHVTYYCLPQVKILVGRFPTQVIRLPLLSTINGSAGKLVFCLLQLNPAMIVVGESSKLCDIPKSVGLDVIALNYRDELTLHESVNTAQ